MDSNALGWDHYESPEKHPSQKGNLHLWVWFVWCNGRMSVLNKGFCSHKHMTLNITLFNL